MPRYCKIHGRIFEVHAEPNAAAANAYMEANPGMGLLAEMPSGECLMAALDNKGVLMAEAPTAILAKVAEDPEYIFGLGWIGADGREVVA